jgi:PEP-CTERM putative exosortase interaction domain
MVMVVCCSSFASAGTISGILGGGVWAGWTQFQDDNVNNGNGEDWVVGSAVDPGFGGQSFDAEYLFYKLDGDTLSLGLQTGFDVVTGKVNTGNKDYYAGDIALSFDGTTNYSHALDFGLLTKDYGDHNVAAVGGYHNGDNSNGTDGAGLYSDIIWNEHVVPGFEVSNPFAMDGGTLVTALVWDSGSGQTGLNSDTSYFRKTSFDVSSFRQGDGSLDVDAHWTMSCGNDAINGSLNETSSPVPEPGTIALLGIGLALFAGVGARRRRQEKQLKKAK